jgi:hypothetical protein
MYENSYTQLTKYGKIIKGDIKMTELEFEEELKKFTTPERVKQYTELYRNITRHKPFSQTECDDYVETKILTDFYDYLSFSYNKH